MHASPAETVLKACFKTKKKALTLNLPPIVVDMIIAFQTFAEVCFSVFVKCLSFKIFLNIRKVYVFQEFAKGLLSICVC